MRIVHLRTMKDGEIQPKGGVTVAYEQLGEVLLYAESRCNPQETFNRKIGRTAATGKLKKYIENPKQKYKAKLKSIPLNGRKPTLALAETLLRS